MIKVLAALMAKNGIVDIATSSQTGRQRSINDVRSCILDSQSAVQLPYAITDVLAAIMFKNGSDEIATSS